MQAWLQKLSSSSASLRKVPLGSGDSDLLGTGCGLPCADIHTRRSSHLDENLLLCNRGLLGNVKSQTFVCNRSIGYVVSLFNKKHCDCYQMISDLSKPVGGTDLRSLKSSRPQSSPKSQPRRPNPGCREQSAEPSPGPSRYAAILEAMMFFRKALIFSQREKKYVI